MAEYINNIPKAYPKIKGQSKKRQNKKHKENKNVKIKT
jgi:hypothetical protein